MHTGNRDIVTSSHDVARKDEEILPGLVICYSLLLKMTIKIADLPMNSMVDLSIVFCERLPGRVHIKWSQLVPSNHYCVMLIPKI
jgi:hypothetical protein